MIELSNDYDFVSKLSDAGPERLVVVDFFATWCGPCTMIAPFYKQLSVKYPAATFLKVDVDKCPGTAAANGVSAMPTFLFFRNRAVVDSLRGANKTELENKVKQHINAPSAHGEGPSASAAAGSEENGAMPPAANSTGEHVRTEQK